MKSCKLFHNAEKTRCMCKKKLQNSSRVFRPKLAKPRSFPFGLMLLTSPVFLQVLWLLRLLAQLKKIKKIYKIFYSFFMLWRGQYEVNTMLVLTAIFAFFEQTNNQELQLLFFYSLSPIERYSAFPESFYNPFEGPS